MNLKSTFEYLSIDNRKGRTEVVEEILESGKELAKEWMGKSATAKELTQRIHSTL